MDDKQAQAEAQSAEAVNAAANAAEAVERARQAQLEAYRAETTRALSEALREVFGEGTASGRFVDVSRIPLICKNIEGIHDSLQEIKTDLKESYPRKDSIDVIDKKVEELRDNQKWVVRIVVGAVLAAILGLVIIK